MSVLSDQRLDILHFVNEIINDYKFIILTGFPKEKSGLWNGGRVAAKRVPLLYERLTPTESSQVKGF